ncbi:MAG: sigma-70 family RNA polymerase sigma factor [Planctomycetes bacterium]|nr:sigma-70 family RNA polymerase sigma factor [Planctomycetota bacterium]
MSDDASRIDPTFLLAHVDGVRRLARSLVFDETVADDVVQETMLVALREPHSRKASSRAWIRGVARNVARRFVRSDKHRSQREKAAARPEAQPSTDGVIARIAEQSRVLTAVMSLDEPYRTAVVLRYFEDLPPREIAERVGAPVETVRTRVKRGLAMLRVELLRRHGDDAREWRLALLPLVGLESKRTGVGAVVGGVMAMKAKVVWIAALLLLAVLALWRFAGSRDERATTIAAVTGAASTTASVLPLNASAPESPDAMATSSVPSVDPNAWRIDGRVVDEDGRPIAGARLRISSADSMGTLDGKPATLSGAEGEFEIRVPGSERVRRVVADADGYRQDSRIVVASRPRDVELRLEAARTMYFIIWDSDTGEPLAGASAETFVLRGGVVSRGLTQSDSQGRFSTPDPGNGRYWDATELRISRDGYQPLKLDMDDRFRAGASTREHPREIDLVAGEGLRVRVLDAETELPVKDANVAAWSGRERTVSVGTGRESGYVGAVSLGEATTNEDGEVVLGAPFREEPLCIVARASGRFGLAWNTSSSPVEEVRLVRTRVVRGVVVDDEDRPVAGAGVSYDLHSLLGIEVGAHLPPLTRQVEQSAETSADANGHFEFPAIPRFHTGGAFWVWSGTDDGTSGGIEVADSPDAADVTIRLVHRSSRFEIHVADDRGSPVFGALVQYLLTYPGDRTDEKGMARLDRCFRPTDFPRMLEIEAPGFAKSSVTLDCYPDEGVALGVTLQAAHVVEGRVVDSDGRPARAEVRVVRADADTALDRTANPFDPGILGTRETNEAGRFRFEDLPEGPYRVRAWNFVNPYRLQASVITAGDEPVQLQLSAPPGGHVAGQRVEGAVFDRDGKRVTRYSMWMQHANGRSLIPRTMAWHFEFENVLPGDYTMEITESTGHEVTKRPLTVRAGEDVTGIRIELSPPATLVGRLDAGDVVDLSDIEVEALDAVTRRSRGSAHTDARGRFEFMHLPAGEYVLELNAREDSRGSFQVAGARFTVTDGDRIDRTFPIKPAGRIVLVVDDERFATREVAFEQQLLDASQNSLMSNVQIFEAGSSRSQWAGSLFRGRTILRNALPVGSYRLHITVLQYPDIDIPVEIVGPRDHEVRVTLPTRTPR